MGTDKSILEKITDTVKDIATLATDAASHALKTEAPAPKTDEEVAMYLPLAADGLVSDPMMVPPIAIAPAPKRAASQRVAKKTGKKTAGKSAAKASKKPAGKANKKSAAKKSKPAAKKAGKKTVKKTVKKATKKTSKKSAKKRAKKVRKGSRG
jgi:hypothetical protein